MTISTINTPTTSSSTASTDSASTALSGNYNMFLQLLVTQLQNQSPLNPMDSTQFTQQLVQYSSVEQQIKSNQTLSDLKTMFAVQSAMSFVGYVGKTVTVDGSTTQLKDGTATWNFNGSAACEKATIEIRDANGNLVYTTTEKLASGDGKFEWKGETTAGVKHAVAWDFKDNNGNAVQSGTYRLNIAPVSENKDDTIKTTTYTFGTVAGIGNNKDGETVLNVGPNEVPLSKLTTVY